MWQLKEKFSEKYSVMYWTVTKGKALVAFFVDKSMAQEFIKSQGG